ncbi:MAG TPA: hypothetical protein VGU66_01630 [Candidatus Elarobacter sp.]|nr:hypothetical protein [Candidatus Elarobacter sp.]
MGSMVTLGDSWPIESTDPKNVVTNIYAFSFTQSGGGTNIWAWMYTEFGGAAYLQENASYRSSFEGFIGGIPALSGVMSAIANSHGGVVSLSSAQGQAVLDNWRRQPNSKAGSCFTKALQT